MRYYQYAREHFSWKQQFEKILSYFDQTDLSPETASTEAASNEDSVHR